MSADLDFLNSIPLPELRRLIALKENQGKIEALMERRDHLLDEARMIQNQIDDLIDAGTGRSRRKRMGPSVKSLCEEVLEAKKGGMSPAEAKNAILERYPHRNKRSLYNQVFIALTRNPGFKKLKNGKFVLAE